MIDKLYEDIFHILILFCDRKCLQYMYCTCSRLKSISLLKDELLQRKCKYQLETPKRLFHTNFPQHSINTIMYVYKNKIFKRQKNKCKQADDSIQLCIKNKDVDELSDFDKLICDNDKIEVQTGNISVHFHHVYYISNTSNTILLFGQKKAHFLDWTHNINTKFILS